ncbi:PREDICTED: endoglin isoform X2 [Gekko japonicus]|uniref:Endoglin isoform X2 n=1 Tax=Gekko japonicus TaxID=146911 RepID=A0ABM1JIN5_GEKJA|nr:PREDICTED: endoglin isoform X2 [Gekko japonicus]
MEKVHCLALLLAFSSATSASPVDVQDCTLQPLEQGQGVRVLYSTGRVPSGCVSRAAPEADREVHVLYLQCGDKSGMSQLFLNVSSADGNSTQRRKVVFVVSANGFSLLTIHSEDLPLTFIYNSENIFLNMNTNNGETNTTALPSFASGEELLKWAKLKYGGVSSFASVGSPQRIHFQVGKEIGTSEDCIPETDFDAGQYLEMDVISSEVKSCPHPSKNPRKEAHIVWLQQGHQDSGTQAVELNMNVTCDKGDPFKELSVVLVLKSQHSLLWNIGSTTHSTQFLVSGKYSLKHMSSGKIDGEALPDSKEGLIRKVHDRGVDFIASYTEIPSANRITLEVVRCEESREAATTPQARSHPHSPTREIEGLINLVVPWRCLENTIEVALAKQYLSVLKDPITIMTLSDSRCVAQDNMTHFVLRSGLEDCFTRVESGIHVKNKLIVTLASLQQVTIPFQCDLPEKLSLQLFSTPEFRLPSTTLEFNEVAYVQVSLRTADQDSSLQLQECSLKATGRTSMPLIRNGTSASSSVEILEVPDNSPGTRIHRFRFVYEAKDGGRPSLSATLVCWVSLNRHNPSSFESSLDVKVNDPNSPSHDQGLGIGTVVGITFGAFLIGVLLTAALWYIYSHTRPLAKMQPVSANPPASESSSTNHSIGSTQSTPCSTSSMA